MGIQGCALKLVLSLSFQRQLDVLTVLLIPHDRKDALLGLKENVTNW